MRDGSYGHLLDPIPVSTSQTAPIAYMAPDPRTWGALPTMAQLVAERDARRLRAAVNASAPCPPEAAVRVAEEIAAQIAAVGDT